MTEVDIEYCHPCGHLERALDVQGAVLGRYGEALESARLVVGDGGVFRVSVDGEEIFDVDEEAYDREAIVERVGTRLEGA